jgi:cyclic-di-GMP-binding protein
MPSVDVVSKIDLQALDNAINNVKREIASRFDFRGVKTEIDFDRKEKIIHLISGDEWKVKTVKDMIIGQCVRQKIDPKSLEFGEVETTSLTAAKMNVTVKEGIPREAAQKMVKYIKSLKTKVQPAIQENQVRLTGKQIDDLQAMMQLLREQDYGVPLQFVNMKS